MALNSFRSDGISLPERFFGVMGLAIEKYKNILDMISLENGYAMCKEGKCHMADRMSNIVLFETKEKLVEYKKVFEDRYSTYNGCDVKIEKYVKRLQQEYPRLEQYSLENQARAVVINALTEAWFIIGMQRTVDRERNHLNQEDAEKMIMSNTLACVAMSIKYLCAPEIEFSSVILDLLKKDVSNEWDRNSVEDCIKSYIDNRKTMVRANGEDSKFCPPILYAPEVTSENLKIKNFMLPIVGQLVKNIGIYHVVNRDDQKRDEIILLGNKLKRWENWTESYKNKMSTQVNGEYKNLIEEAHKEKLEKPMGNSVSEKVMTYYAKESIFRYGTFLNIASYINEMPLNNKDDFQRTKYFITQKIERPVVFYIHEFEKTDLLDSTDKIILFCEYMRVVMLLMVESVVWIEPIDKKIEHAYKLICDYLDNSFKRLFEEAYDAVEGKKVQYENFKRKYQPEQVKIIKFIIELYSIRDRYKYNESFGAIYWNKASLKQVGLDLGYKNIGSKGKNCDIKIDGRSYLYTERKYGISYDLQTRKIKRKNAKAEECEWKDITIATIDQLATEIYEEQPLIQAGKDPEHERMYKIIICRNIVKEICKDLEKLGVVLTAEDINMANSKCSDYYTAEEHAYIESVMFPNSQVSDET